MDHVFKDKNGYYIYKWSIVKRFQYKKYLKN